MAAGSNRLLYDGARVVRGPEDVLELLFGVGSVPEPPSIADDLEPELRSVLDAVECGDGIEATARETRLSAGGGGGARPARGAPAAAARAPPRAPPRARP